MAISANIHKTQAGILRNLSLQMAESFSALQKSTGKTSENFSFHLKKLVEVGLVIKNPRGQYLLSDTGKDYIDALNKDSNVIELRPKTSVILVIERQIGGKIEYLFQERLKQPYYGFWGLISGKIRWGETIIQTAHRELMEETGLLADFRFAGIYHELAFEKGSDNQLEDKVFFVMHGTNVHGKLMDEFEGGRNAWMTFDGFNLMKNKFMNMDIKIGLTLSVAKFIERRVEYDKNMF